MAPSHPVAAEVDRLRRIQAQAAAGPAAQWEVALLDLADAIAAQNAGTDDGGDSYRPVLLGPGWEPLGVTVLDGEAVLVVRRQVQ